MVARNLTSRRTTEETLSLGDALLRARSPSEACRILVDRLEEELDCEWCAALHLSGEVTILAVTAAVGNVPAALHEAHNMTPSELASALGWQPDGPTAQICELKATDRLRGLDRAGSEIIVASLRGDGEVCGIVIVGRDPGKGFDERATFVVEELCGLTAPTIAYANLIDDLRVSDRTKSEFVATMSHELRTPLSAILGYIDLLLHGDLGTIADEQEGVLRRAHYSASALLDLINATLDVSRFEVGDRRGDDANVDLLGLLREQIEETAVAHQSDAVRIDDASSGEPLEVFADPLKLRVALRQVLEAAVASSGDSELRVVAQRSDDGVEVVVGPTDATSEAQHAHVLIELPEDGDAPGAPFSVFVGKRLLEILGGTLAAWRHEDRVGFRMWLPTSLPTDLSLPRQ